jgi:glycosyltransferase involved in cell wall biosynthesis
MRSALEATDLSIVLPCYNEKENISTLVQSYVAAMGQRKNIEVVLVDNGSTDNSSEEIHKVLNLLNDSRFRTTKVEINQGYGFGILSGLKVSRGKFLAWSHADQQCSPSDVFNVYDAVLNSKNPQKTFGKGHRNNDRGRAVILTLIQEFLSKLILGKTMTEINAQPKVFHRALFENFQKPPNGYELDIYAYYKALLLNYEIVPINVIFHERKHGQSKWAFSLKSKLKQIIRNFVYLLFLKSNQGSL